MSFRVKLLAGAVALTGFSVVYSAYDNYVNDNAICRDPDRVSGASLQVIDTGNLYIGPRSQDVMPVITTTLKIGSIPGFRTTCTFDLSSLEEWTTPLKEHLHLKY